MRACSACAGDYEDPDRTAGEEFEDLLAGDEGYEWDGEEDGVPDVDEFELGMSE
jgi:hypothetical protein